MSVKDKVLQLHKQGAKPMEIARLLQQSPFIVNQIIKGAK